MGTGTAEEGTFPSQIISTNDRSPRHFLRYENVMVIILAMAGAALPFRRIGIGRNRPCALSPRNKAAPAKWLPRPR